MSVAWPSDLPPPVFPIAEEDRVPMAVHDFRIRERRRRVDRPFARLRCTFLLRPDEWARWLSFWETDTAEGVLPVDLRASWIGRAMTARMEPDHRVTVQGRLRRLEMVFEEV